MMIEQSGAAMGGGTRSGFGGEQNVLQADGVGAAAPAAVVDRVADGEARGVEPGADLRFVVGHRGFWRLGIQDAAAIAMPLNKGALDRVAEGEAAGEPGA